MDEGYSAGTGSRATIALIALVTGAILMGASPVLVRLADVGPFASAFWRVTLALPVLWAWERIESRPQPCADRRLGAAAIVLAGLFFAGDLFFWHLAIFNTTVANATFFATTAPFWVLLGAWLMRSEIVTRPMIAGLVLAFGGGVLLVGESLHVDPGRVVGDLYGVVTGMFFGAYMLALRAARRFQEAARITFISSLVTSAMLALVALALEPRLVPETARGLAALAALALLSHAGGQGLLAFSLGHLPATFSSLVIFMEALAAAAFGWVALGEAVSPLQAVGGAVILAGIWVARPRPNRARPR